MEKPTIILIRSFKAGDEAGIQRVIREGTMSTVNPFFLQSLMREIFFQAVVTVSAIMFILLGVPFYWIFSSVPVVAAIFYIVIWCSHYYKAHYMHTDLNDIPKSYISNTTCFYVAEAFGSLSRNKSNPAAFINESEFEQLVRNGSIAKSGTIIGTVGISRDRGSAVIAWLRRMAVKKEWRNHGVGSKLLDAVIKFCNQKSFVAIELVTTECHNSARILYEKKGFEMKQLYHKKVLHLSSLCITMHFMSYKTRPTSTGTLDL